jgi:opacity protein-like surface antigen
MLIVYRKLLCLSVLIFGLSSSVLAEDLNVGGDDYAAHGGSDVASSALYNPGIYFGAQFGTANMRYSGNLQYTTPTSVYDDKYQMAARGCFGYAFSQFISVELGYDYYGQPKFWNTDGNNQSIMQHGMDLMAKASLPLDYGFGIYIKGGMAWVYRSALRDNKGSFASRESNNKFPPIGALGINYWFAPNIALDFCWTKTMHLDNLPTVDLFTAGIIYRINI